MARILITGGCGFIGSSLALDLTQRGHAVMVLDNLSRRGSELILPQLLAQGVGFQHADIRNAEDVDKLKADFNCLIECSAEPSVMSGAEGEEARYLLNVNLHGALNIFEWARQRKVPVIFLSSSRVYPYDRLNACQFRETATRFEFVDGCPGVSADGVSVNMPLEGVRSLYGASKLAAEFILKEYAVQYSLPAIINRCGVVAGPWQMARADQGIFTFWMARHYFKIPLEYFGFGGNGHQVRDLLHVQDLADLVARQVTALIEKPSDFPGSIYNAGGSSRSTLSLKETTALCRQITGHDVPVTARITDRPLDMRWYVTDNGDTAKTFGWAPVRSPQDTLQDIFTWINTHETTLKGLLS